MNPGKQKRSKTTGELYRVCVCLPAKALFCPVASYTQKILKPLAPVLNTTGFLRTGETEASCGSRSDSPKHVKHWVAKQRAEPLCLNA